MHKILKYKYADSENHFWGSDFHNYHDPNWTIPIWKGRGYSSPDESQKDVQKKINDKIGKDQYLWMLGDSFLSATDQQVIDWWAGINCENVMMLMGNHESQMYRLYKQEMLAQFGRFDIEVYPLRMKNVVFLGNHQEIWIGKQQIVMNHFPLHTHHGANRGSWNISGHEHRNDPSREPSYPINKCLDVSWDKKLDVWSFSEIADVMSTKEIFIPDHHRD
jgi:calcineurin-like phosphoesterase family protein